MDTMAATPRKAIALLTTAAGLGIVLVAGVMLYRPLEERYWLWKLREGEESEKERAADRLAELKVEEAVAILVDLIPRQLPESHSALSWIEITQVIRQDRYWKRALVKHEEVAVPYLQEILREESVLARSYAAYILGKIGPTAMEAVPDILEAVRTAMKGPPVTYFAYFALYGLKRISPDAEKEAAALINIGWLD